MRPVRLTRAWCCAQNDKPFNKVLAANRGEIAIRICRAAHELQMETVSIFSQEDVAAAHRHKADESYIVGEGLSPVGAYLSIDSIIETASKAGVEAIHPGYVRPNGAFPRSILCTGFGLDARLCTGLP